VSRFSCVSAAGADGFVKAGFPRARFYVGAGVFLGAAAHGADAGSAYRGREYLGVEGGETYTAADLADGVAGIGAECVAAAFGSEILADMGEFSFVDFDVCVHVLAGLGKYVQLA